MKNTLLTIMATLFFQTGCNQSRDSRLDNLGRANTTTSTGSSTAVSPKKPDTKHNIIRGTITGLIDVENYTYIHFKTTDGTQKWAAVFKGTFKKGQQIGILKSIEMTSFKSPTLNRTFDRIIFGGVVELNNSQVEPAPDPRQNTNQELPPGHPPIN
jgi:hypothetical protein